MKHKFRFLNQEEGQIGEGGPVATAPVEVPRPEEVAPPPKEDTSAFEAKLEEMQYALLLTQNQVPPEVQAYLPTTSQALKTFLESDSYKKLTEAFATPAEVAPAVPVPPAQVPAQVPTGPKEPNFARVGRRLML